MKVSLSCLVIFLVLNSVSGRTEYNCNKPETWCLNKQTAKNCNVEDQCRKFVWLNKEGEKEADPVELNLYYEVLCPDCKQFISDQVGKAVEQIGDIMNLTLVPYGNAQEKWDERIKEWRYKCQHGEMECWGNLLHTCVLHYYPQTSQHFPFIQCMESAKSNVNEDIKDVANKCAAQTRTSIDEPLKCLTSTMGNKLQHELAVATESLDPPHQYVPWITLNGEHTEDMQKKAQENLVKLICDAFKGVNKPEACV